MTKDEAIKILQGAIKTPNTKDGYLGQAIDMAIKSLEAWEKILKEMNIMVNDFWSPKEYKYGVLECKKMIKECLKEAEDEG